jgi:hypothetical protein
MVAKPAVRRDDPHISRENTFRIIRKFFIPTPQKLFHSFTESFLRGQRKKREKRFLREGWPPSKRAVFAQSERI